MTNAWPEPIGADRPDQVDQLDGSRLAGFNCTCAAGAVALDRWTLGRLRTTGARVRLLTGDTIGGTTLRQVAAAIERGWGFSLDVHTPMDFLAMEQRIHAGQGGIIQGRESVYRGTRFQSSETFGGNHASFMNEGRNWHQGSDAFWRAEEYLIFNPLADGRRKGIAQSPYWVPRDLVVEWCGKLDVADPATKYLPLGQGLVYVAFTRDTEPHLHSEYGAKQTSPFPLHLVTHRATPSKAPINVRAQPKARSALVGTLPVGTTIRAYGVATGGLASGTRKWYCAHDGKHWISASKVKVK
jgi:hypothetical protein